MSIELIVMDVDGTMTDGSITYSNNGEELKSFNVKDGLGIASWGMLGKKSAIITGRSSKIVEKRAKELKVDFIRQGVKNKLDELFEIAEICQLTMNQIAIIGDDWNDYSMMKTDALTFAPSNATNSIKDIADYILKSKGGEGAVREMIDIIIQRDNLSQKMLKLWSINLN